jgi:hypothetical protein
MLCGRQKSTPAAAGHHREIDPYVGWQTVARRSGQTAATLPGMRCPLRTTSSRSSPATTARHLCDLRARGLALRMCDAATATARLLPTDGHPTGRDGGGCWASRGHGRTKGDARFAAPPGVTTAPLPVVQGQAVRCASAGSRSAAVPRAQRNFVARPRRVHRFLMAQLATSAVCLRFYQIGPRLAAAVDERPHLATRSA